MGGKYFESYFKLFPEFRTCFIVVLPNCTLQGQVSLGRPDQSRGMNLPSMLFGRSKKINVYYIKVKALKNYQSISGVSGNKTYIVQRIVTN